jgi:hypothetical protein
MALGISVLKIVTTFTNQYAFSKNNVAFDDVQADGFAVVAGLRGNSSVPYKIILDIIESFNSMS